MKLSLVFLFILLFTAFSISNNQKSSGNDVQAEENQYLLHAESSERLLKIMKQISPIAGEVNVEGLNTLTEEDTTNLIEAVEELMFYAELMTVKIPATELEQSQNVIFSAMASKLYDEALNIQQLSKNYDLESTDHSQEYVLNEAFTRLSQTCNACHQLFRDK